MPLLPAVVPDIPESRTEVAAARLARKIAPLFGVPWPDGPLGGRTWVCDYTKITLSEIGRGAPLPTRQEAAELPAPADGRWEVLDRIGVTAPGIGLPNEIANATLNRFGPDTRAAVVLTGVNRLLAPVTDAVRAALGLLVDTDGRQLPAPLRLAAWAGLVVEVFRSQPALLAAGIHARAIQLELVRTWQLPLAGRLTGIPLTRCEIGREPDRPTTAPTQPATLDVADLTFTGLELDRELRQTGAPAFDEPPGLTDRLRHDESVDLLLRRLLATGTAADTSFLWLSERGTDQLAVEALLPPTELVDRFVRHSHRLLGATDPVAEPRFVLPAVPTTEQLAALPLLGRRAALLALLAVLRHVQYSPTGWEQTRKGIVDVLRGIALLSRQVLDADDPVAAVTECRVADMIVQTVRADTREELAEPLQDLLAGLDRCEDLLRQGVLDRGAAAEAISSACVELNAVAQTNAALPGSGLPSPEKLVDRVRRGWLAFHRALEIADHPVAAGEPSVPDLAAYHLHNYAAFLAASATTDAALHEAVELFEHVVIPARQAFFARSGNFRPVRHSLQTATRATGRLAEAARDRGETEVAVRWARRGRDWISAALTAEDTERLLSEPTESACRFALRAAPALVLAAEVGVPDAADDVQRAADLLDLARRWEERTIGPRERHARHAEVIALADRLATLTGSG